MKGRLDMAGWVLPTLGYAALLGAAGVTIKLALETIDWRQLVLWVPIAYVLAAIVAVLTVVGVGWFQTSAGGYGGTKEKIIGFSVLAISILLFFYRRLVQDKQPIRWREDVNAVPDEHEQALIDAEMKVAT